MESDDVSLKAGDDHEMIRADRAAWLGVMQQETDLKRPDQDGSRLDRRSNARQRSPGIAAVASLAAPTE